MVEFFTSFDCDNIIGIVKYVIKVAKKNQTTINSRFKIHLSDKTCCKYIYGNLNRT